MASSIETKKMLHNECLRIINEKLNVAKQGLTELQESASSDTKSTAGDKHETGLAMAQLEMEQLTIQMAEIEKLKQVLISINPNVTSNSVHLGSLVHTNKGIFYLSVSLGKVMLNDQPYFVISNASPIGQLLLNKSKGDIFTFNNMEYILFEIS